MIKECMVLLCLDARIADTVADYQINPSNGRLKKAGRPEELALEYRKKLTDLYKATGSLNLARVVNLILSDGWDLVPIYTDDDLMIFTREVPDGTKTY